MPSKKEPNTLKTKPAKPQASSRAEPATESPAARAADKLASALFKVTHRIESAWNGPNVQIFGFSVGRDNVFIFFGTILLLLAICTYFYFIPAPKVVVSYSEQPLMNVAEFSLENGSSFTYDYIFNSTLVGQVTVVAQTRPSCTALQTFSTMGSSPLVCVNLSGADLYDSNRQNLSLANGTVDIFSPWMLAATDGWVWKANLSAEVSGIGLVSQTDVEFREIGREKSLGRDSHKIKITMRSENESMNFIAWVDDASRVLLREEGDAGSIELVRAPFPLTLGNGTIVPASEKVVLNETAVASIYSGSS